MHRTPGAVPTNPDPPDLSPDGTTFVFDGKPYVFKPYAVGADVVVGAFTTQPAEDSDEDGPSGKTLTLSVEHLLQGSPHETRATLDEAPHLRRSNGVVRHALHRPRPIGRRTGRHEARPARRMTRREGASSATSSSDPPPDGDSDSDGESEPPAGRPCACGCGRPAPPKGKGATRADCRKQQERERKAVAAREPDASRWERTLPLAAYAVQVVQAVADGELAERTGRPLVAVLENARKELLGLDTLGAQRCEELHHTAVILDPDGDAICLACGRYRGKIASRINGFDLHDAVMREVAWAS